ncbi:four helix bundle protein [Mucilaginibacter sp. McL0603]|uniref:four helix bundle protein n=1 Tax=Mucilaginibacter sp. McL0603 TaxID=3415670 RepID=UPI003CFAF9CA
MGTYKDLLLYKKTFALAMEIHTVTKKFPKERDVFAYRSDSKIIPFSKYLFN